MGNSHISMDRISARALAIMLLDALKDKTLKDFYVKGDRLDCFDELEIDTHDPVWVHYSFSREHNKVWREEGEELKTIVIADDLSA